MKKELLELKSYLCSILEGDILFNYGKQECKRLVQLIDIVLLDKLEDRHRDLTPLKYFEGSVLGTRVVLGQHNEEITNKIIELIDNVLDAGACV